LFVGRKRLQKDKDEKQTDKHRDETEQMPQQQQKDVDKAAAAGAGEQQAFVMPVDPTLLQYITDCVDTIRPLPNAQQQASALARSFELTALLS